MASKNNTIYRDESKLHKVPDWIIYTMPLNIFLMLIGIILVIVGIAKDGINYLGVGVFTLTLFWGIFVDKYFNFYNNCRYDINTNKIIFMYDLSNSILPQTNCTVKIEVFKVTKLKARKNSVTVWGTISKSAPRQATKTLNKVDLRLDFKERDLILEKLYTLKDRR